MSLRRRAFERAYRNDVARWDTGVTPPEVVAAIERPLPAGRALDLGCGTGTNALYLARHGWEVVGVDLSPLAIQAATSKLQVSRLEGVVFVRADVTRLDLGRKFDFLLDIGCFHSLPRFRRRAYSRVAAQHAASGATLMIFAWGPRRLVPGPRRTREGEIRRRFGGAFDLLEVEPGREPPGAAWFSLRRR